MIGTLLKCFVTQDTSPFDALQTATTVEEVLRIVRIATIDFFNFEHAHEYCRKHKLSIWFYGLPPRLGYKSILWGNFNGNQLYVGHVFFGTQDEFVNDFLPTIGVTYMDTLDRLDLCGFETIEEHEFASL